MKRHLLNGIVFFVSLVSVSIASPTDSILKPHCELGPKVTQSGPYQWATSNYAHCLQIQENGVMSEVAPEVCEIAIGFKHERAPNGTCWRMTCGRYMISMAERSECDGDLMLRAQEEGKRASAGSGGCVNKGTSGATTGYVLPSSPGSDSGLWQIAPTGGLPLLKYYK